MKDRLFQCLNGNDVITARVSDHHPIIHNGVLLWNLMMQARLRREGGYNNGFGLIENDEQYRKRLIKIAHVIAEMVYQHPSIETIGLCEGPIQLVHINSFIQSLKKFTCMRRFFARDMFYKPGVDKFPNWGLLMLTDRNNKLVK